MKTHEYPTVDELSATAREQLRKTPITVENVDQFEDDHAPCINATVNGVEVSFWWLDYEGAAAFHMSESPKAQAILAEIINSELMDASGSADDTATEVAEASVEGDVDGEGVVPYPD